MLGLKLTKFLDGVFVWLLIHGPLVNLAERDAVVVAIEVHTRDSNVAARTAWGSLENRGKAGVRDWRRVG
jgi:hypothetical protein